MEKPLLIPEPLLSNLFGYLNCSSYKESLSNVHIAEKTCNICHFALSYLSGWLFPVPYILSANFITLLRAK